MNGRWQAICKHAMGGRLAEARMRWAGMHETRSAIMEAFLQKYNWAINFALLGLGALLSALLINGFVAAQLANFTVPKMPPLTAQDEAERSSGADDGLRDQWVDSLAQRCLFGCPEEEDPDVCPDGCEEGEVCEFGECVPEIDDGDGEEYDLPQVTELEIKLMGVMVAQNSRWSMAMIHDDGEDKTHVVGVGDMLPFEAPVEVVEIRRDRVFLDNDGRSEFVRLQGSPEGNPEAPPRRPRAQRQRDSDDDSGERSGVVASGDNEMNVERSRVEAALEDQEQLAREARVMPNYRDGEPDGLRLVGVRPDSLYSDLGIRSGDVIHSVNGEPLTNQREALQMLETMKNTRDVTIELERRGRRQEMKYNIR